MRRKSDRSKSKSSSDKKSPEKSTRRSRRLKRTPSKSPERNSDGRSDSEQDDKHRPEATNAQTSSTTSETIAKNSTVVTKDVDHKSGDETKESVWQVQSTEPSDAGEIQKLKICLKRPSSTPERSEKSPRGHRDIQSCSSQDSSDEKRTKKTKKREVSVSDVEKENVGGAPVEPVHVTPVEIIVTPEKKDDIVQVKKESTSNLENNVPVTENNQDNLKTEHEQASEEKISLETSENVEKESIGLKESTEIPAEKESPETPDLTVKSDEGKLDVKNIESQPILPEESLTSEKEEICIPAVKLEHEPDDVNVESKPEIAKESNSDIKESDCKILQPYADTNVADSSEGNEIKACVSGNNDQASESNTKEEEKPAQPQVPDAAEETKELTKTDTVVKDEPLENTNEKRRKSDASELTKNSSRDSETSSEEERSDRKRDFNRKMSSDSKYSRKSEKDYHSDSSSNRKSHIKNVSRSHTPEKQNTSNKNTIAEEMVSSEKENKFEKNKEKSLTTQVSESEKLPRKRRWGSKKNNTSDKKPILAISTDSLKNLISEVKPLSVNDVQLEDTVERKEKTVIKNENSLDAYEERPEKRKRSTEVDKIIPEQKETRKRQLSESEKHETRTTHRKISIVMDEGDRKSPSKSTSSEVLYITNLVRPFTVLQLKGLLQRTGKIIENGFWIDNIKSKCYVHYETEDQAVETRHALHGVRWPVSNPKHLQVEFASLQDMEKCVNNVVAPADIKRTTDRDSIVEAWVRDQNSRDDRNKDKGESNRKPIVREWDMGKQDPITSPEKQARDDIPDTIRERERDRTGRDQSRENRDTRDRKRRSRSPSPVRKYKKKEEVAPSKRLDDLFRKTKTAPCLYWLPLTPEQIAVKEEMRRQHMAEHERRKEEIRRQEQREKEREKERIRERERNRTRTRDRSDSRQTRGGDRYH